MFIVEMVYGMSIVV